MVKETREAFHRRFERAPALVARAPGRVNLLGEHVDYNDGWVLPVAIDRAAYVAASTRSDDLVTIVAADLAAEVTLDPRTLAAKVDASGRPLEPWALYPAGVAAALMARGLPLRGINALLRSDVPRGAGVSSSAAVEIAFALAWSALGGWSLPAVDLATTCRAAENDYVGVGCGIMDQLASACGVRDHALLLDCRTLEWRAIALPPGLAIVIGDTGVRRELASGAFNERRTECAKALHLLREALPHVRALRDVTLDDLALHGPKLPARLRARALHVVGECARVRHGAELLEQGEVGAFGALLDASHASLRDLYQVSCPELDAMAAAARRIDGCLGARLTGAGFGGCVVALVRGEAVAGFTRALARDYGRVTGRNTVISVCRASTGATVENLNVEEMDA